MDHLTPAEKTELAQLRAEAARLERRQSDLARRANRAPSTALTLNETAENLNLTTRQVRRIQAKAQIKLSRNPELRNLLNITP